MKKMGRSIRAIKGDMLNLAAKVDKNKEGMTVMVERAVSDKVSALANKTNVQAPGVRPRGTSAITDHSKADKYNKARRSLRFWPILDLSEDVVRDFLTSKLGISQKRADLLDSRTKRLVSQPRDPDYQALVTFDDSRKRDEVKAAARNLMDRQVGVQMVQPTTRLSILMYP